MFNDYDRQSSVTTRTGSLKWPLLQQWRANAKVVIMYRIINGLAAIPANKYLVATGSQTPRAQNPVPPTSRAGIQAFVLSIRHTDMKYAASRKSLQAISREPLRPKFAFDTQMRLAPKCENTQQLWDALRVHC